jgi:CRISPR system Cascade subunit CasE
MSALYLSRARLKADRGEALSSIAPVLLPDTPSQRAGVGHRLVWLLFQDIPDAARDFIWREEGDGRYMILSPRAPANRNDLFELETKPFEPQLAQGDELRFVLRANPTVARKGALTDDAKAARHRGKRVDVVMDALSKVPKTERALKRDDCVRLAGRKWLDEQGSRSGFTVQSLEVSGYLPTDVSDRERPSRRKRATVSLLDFAGELRVEDPVAFLSKLEMGFGSAKAFGCGLMLIRRA